jgi:hypothetical protein
VARTPILFNSIHFNSCCAFNLNTSRYYKWKPRIPSEQHSSNVMCYNFLVTEILTCYLRFMCWIFVTFPKNSSDFHFDTVIRSEDEAWTNKYLTIFSRFMYWNLYKNLRDLLYWWQSFWGNKLIWSAYVSSRYAPFSSHSSKFSSTFLVPLSKPHMRSNDGAASHSCSPYTPAYNGFV